MGMTKNQGRVPKGGRDGGQFAAGRRDEPIEIELGGGTTAVDERERLGEAIKAHLSAERALTAIPPDHPDFLRRPKGRGYDYTAGRNYDPARSITSIIDADGFDRRTETDTIEPCVAAWNSALSEVGLPKRCKIEYGEDGVSRISVVSELDELAGGQFVSSCHLCDLFQVDGSKPHDDQIVEAFHDLMHETSSVDKFIALVRQNAHT